MVKKSLFALFLIISTSMFAMANENVGIEKQDTSIWVTFEVGSPYYNYILEAHDKEAKDFWENDLVKLAVRDVEVGKRFSEIGEIVTGEKFQVNTQTGKTQRALDLTPALVKEFKNSGLLLVDIGWDTFYYIPMDIAKDMIHSFNPMQTSEDKHLTMGELLTQQLSNIWMDVRTAVGITTERNGVGESGLAKVVVSIFTFSPSGVGHGVWDIGVGVVGATEDTVFGILKVARRGIKGFFSWFIHIISSPFQSEE